MLTITQLWSWAGTTSPSGSYCLVRFVLLTISLPHQLFDKLLDFFFVALSMDKTNDYGISKFFTRDKCTIYRVLLSFAALPCTKFQPIRSLFLTPVQYESNVLL